MLVGLFLDIEWVVFFLLMGVPFKGFYLGCVIQEKQGVIINLQKIEHLLNFQVASFAEKNLHLPGVSSILFVHFVHRQVRHPHSLLDIRRWCCLVLFV